MDFDLIDHFCHRCPDKIAISIIVRGGCQNCCVHEICDSCILEQDRKDTKIVECVICF